MNPALTAVITTVAEPTPSVRKLAAALESGPFRLVVVGDKKGPAKFELGGVDFLSLDDQLRSPFTLASLLPVGHYARKNLGYLAAIRHGAKCIYETDDDNAPLPGWKPRSISVDAQRVEAQRWINVYRLFSDEPIWPRGFPLGAIGDPAGFSHDPGVPTCRVEAPIQQGLVDGSPDVDAIWRLVMDREFVFRKGPSVWLPPGAWCPFNSQSTWWWPAVYPLMYLPSCCSFRMTDIWRSFVAQRCLWELGAGVVFHAPEVAQTRNAHDLMKDFRDELPGYLGNEEIANDLMELRLDPGVRSVGGNLLRCYEKLVTKGHFPPDELRLIGAWMDDLERIRPNEE